MANFGILGINWIEPLERGKALVPYIVKNNQNTYLTAPKSIRFPDIHFSFWVTSISTTKITYRKHMETIYT